MNAVAYCHPFVPPEWIAAHGLRPLWLPCAAGDGPAGPVRRGVCPVAAARLDELAGPLPAEAVVLTTTCDQIRYAAAVVQHLGKLPLFLMHVPRTWQTAAMRAYYRSELERLGRFLVACGGRSPDDDAVSRTMLQYDEARLPLRSGHDAVPASAYAQAINAVRGDLSSVAGTLRVPSAPTYFTDRKPSVRLALVGGPMSQGDYQWLAAFEDRGVCFVLDATESGERTLPAPIDRDRLRADPLEELVRIYFDFVPDVFQRPNDRMFAWLRQQIAARDVQAIVVRRFVWCDQWHGEVQRLREEIGVPVLEWEGVADDTRGRAGAAGRIEAFLEMLR
jgi:benzoyl-CoA reductase/2-hydroxyglutaryl-CoA dehydratase subunit BcrC/BadD/HgdB